MWSKLKLFAPLGGRSWIEILCLLSCQPTQMTKSSKYFHPCHVLKPQIFRGIWQHPYCLAGGKNTWKIRHWLKKKSASEIFIYGLHIIRSQKIRVPKIFTVSPHSNFQSRLCLKLLLQKWQMLRPLSGTGHWSSSYSLHSIDQWEPGGCNKSLLCPKVSWADFWHCVTERLQDK